MVNANDDIKSDKLSNIGHTLGLIREAKEVASSLIRDLEKQVKALNT